MKKLLSIILAITMVLSLSVSVFAAPVNKAAPIISDLAFFYNNEDQSEAGLEFTIKLTEENKALIAQYEGFDSFVFMNGEISIDGGEWQSLDPRESFDLEIDGQRVRTNVSDDISAEKFVKYRVCVRAVDPEISDWVGEWSNVLTLNEKIDIQASDWAKEELAKADELGLIPDSLQGQDLTQDITRAEFAAVSVKAYEALAATKALPATENPFADCIDVEVLKAYNVGITGGVSATEFSPNTVLNREQAATMLTRVFKRVTKPGWTLATDSQFKLDYVKPTLFADDKDISDWAKDSVYFMAANGIIAGVGDNKFAPKNVTTEEQATGYANATREQALIIAVRMVENLKK